SGPTSTTQPSTANASKKIQNTAQGVSSVPYSVPAAPYVLTIKTTQRCYIQVKSLASGAFLFNRTLGPGVKQPVIVPSGSASLEAFARGSSLSVRVPGPW